MPTSPRIALAPEPADYAREAVARGGGTVVALEEEPDALVWALPGAWDGLADALATAPGVRWVQLPFAGVEPVMQTGVVDGSRLWTCAKGVYGQPVAEGALAMLLALMRRIPGYSRRSTWTGQSASTLFGKRVLVLGGGGIAAELVALLQPFRAEVVVLRRTGAPLDGAARVGTLADLLAELPRADAVVLALALTPETERIVDRDALSRMRSDAWLVNVARGPHVDTDALVEVLRTGGIAGAALDVTDPEPLPDGHPLWSLDNCLITPHTTNPWETAWPRLAERIAENVRRFARGERLLGLVDPAAGY